MRILIAKSGLDGHDRGAIVVTKALRAEGFETAYSGIRRTPREIAALAVRLEADCVGLSSLAGGHMSLFPKVLDALREAQWRGRLVIAGGIIPPEDEAKLRKLGVAAFFGPGSSTRDIAEYLRRALRHGTENENEVV